MDRRKFIAGTGLAGILATGTAPAVHAQGATIRWRLASSFPKSLETLFGLIARFHLDLTVVNKTPGCLMAMALS